MAICPNCKTDVLEKTNFCPTCGTKISVEETQSIQEEEVIDLSNQQETAAPQEKKYKPLFWASIISAVLFLLISLVGMLFHLQVMEGSKERLFFALLFVSIPFILLFLPILFATKKLAKTTTRKVEKKFATIIYVITFLLIAVAQIMGFSHGFSEVGLLPSLIFYLYLAIAIVYVITCNALAGQNGREGLYCLCKAIFWGLVLSSPLGFVIGSILKAIEFGLIIVIILFVAFFLFGGRLIFVRRN